jgi:hypothetical protein
LTWSSAGGPANLEEVKFFENQEQFNDFENDLLFKHGFYKYYNYFYFFPRPPTAGSWQTD